MRVVLVAEQLRRSTPGGIGTYVNGLARGLRAHAGVEVTLWASRSRRRPDPLADLGHVHTSPVPGPLLVWSWDRGLGWSTPSGDVVHAPSLAMPPVKKAPTSVTVHDLAWRQLPQAYPERGRRWHEAALARVVRSAAAFVVPSEATAEALAEAGAEPGRVEVIEEGSDHLPAADRAATDAVLGRVGVHGEFLLTVSTLEPRKNLGRLVAAYAAARPRLPEPWPLVVVGPAGWGRVDDFDSPGVVPAGAVEGSALAGLYERARLVAYVPLTEGFGLPPVEAMRAGTPVVASPVPSIGDAAFEVDPLDVGAIAEALVVVAVDDVTRARLVERGRARAGGLTWEAAAARHVDLWRRLL